jgi:signal transduction histidine kinase
MTPTPADRSPRIASAIHLLGAFAAGGAAGQVHPGLMLALVPVVLLPVLPPHRAVAPAAAAVALIALAPFAGVWPAGLAILAAAAASGAAAVAHRRSPERALARQRAELERELQRLEARNEALEQFNAAVSHDLRSPLTAVRLSVEMARGEADLGEAERLLEDALEGTRRMEGMVRELLGLAKAGGELINPEPVALDQVAGEALVGLAALARTSGARVELRGPLPHALGSPALLRQVVQNLVENAIKYGAEGGARVRVSGGRVGAEVFIDVEDDGPGVAEKDRERIFAPFVQLDRRRGGAGAGLALVRRIVSAHRGTVTVDRSRGLPGARFRVVLPAAVELRQAS